MPPRRSEADVLAGVEFVPWQEFLDQRFVWRQGEHVSTIGPTGCGKSTLTRAILPRREYVVVAGTKPRDRTLDEFVREGYVRSTSWPPRRRWWQEQPPGWDDRVIVWPRFTGAGSMQEQADTFRAVFEDVFAEGGWCVVVDEVFYMCDELKLKSWLTTLWTQGRSMGLSIVAGTQRPAFVPLHMYDQASHLFLFADNDERNLQRVGGLGGLSAVTIRETVAALPRHECLYVNTRDRTLLRTRVERGS